MRVNKKAVDKRVDTTARLAGGMGAHPAVQNAEALLRRSVLANLLWENVAYEDGQSVADNIKTLIPQVAPDAVAQIAYDARHKQKLRHVPLFIVREMARLATHRHLVGSLLPQIIQRPDEITEFMALYWKEKKEPLSKQVKLGLAAAFNNFDAYQFAKYNRDTEIKLRDVLFLVHPRPAQGREELFKQIAENTLPTPDTWEVALSAGADKKATWERLLSEKKLGTLAFLRNLRNMEQAGVDPKVIRVAFANSNTRWLLPLNCLAAAKATPQWEREIEALMLRGLANGPKLPGRTVLVADVSGSMGNPISSKSDFRRLDACAAMMMLGAEMCESVAIYATAGDDRARKHQTAQLAPRRGFAMATEILNSAQRLGGGGIFTRQCLEYIAGQEREKPDRQVFIHAPHTVGWYIAGQEREKPDRIIVFSDSQDCDLPDLRVPKPFGTYNYIVDVSANTRGINYKGAWTAEISGWSEHFLTFIAAMEGQAVETDEE